MRLVSHRMYLSITAILVFLIMSLVSGCADNSSQNTISADSLKNDAVMSLKGSYGEDFTRITIIRGALYKYLVNQQNPQNLGIAIGALEATTFAEQYELKRFDHLDNMSAALRKEIISQPMLGITLRKREVLSHIYNAVLKPVAGQVETSQPITAQDTLVLNNLIALLDTLAQDYSILADKNVDFYSNDAQSAFFSMQNTFREMQKLDLIKKPANP